MAQLFRMSVLSFVSWIGGLGSGGFIVICLGANVLAARLFVPRFHASSCLDDRRRTFALSSSQLHPADPTPHGGTTTNRATRYGAQIAAPSVPGATYHVAWNIRRVAGSPSSDLFLY